MATKIITLSVDEDTLKMHEKAVSSKRGLSGEIYCQGLQDYFGRAFDIDKMERQIKISQSNIETEKVKLTNLKEQKRQFLKLERSMAEKNHKDLKISQNEQEIRINEGTIQRLYDYCTRRLKLEQKHRVECKNLIIGFLDLSQRARRGYTDMNKREEAVVNYLTTKGFRVERGVLEKK